MSLVSRYSVAIELTGEAGTLTFFDQPDALDVDLAPFFLGPPGPPGPPGDGLQSDPGDFTLLFENQLI